MLGGFLNLIVIGGLPIIFLMVFLEGNPLVGSFIPGQAILIMLSFLVATKNFVNLWLFAIVVFCGAFLGDILGFYIGKKYGVKIFKICKVKKNSGFYKASSIFFKKYGPWSIILGREFNPTRAFIPFFAGFSGMTYTTFLLFAFISNILWVSISIYLGFYFGYFILNKISFFSYFLIFIIIYYIFISFLYRHLAKFYFENYFLQKKYAIYNMLVIGFSLFFLFILLIYNKLLGLDYFNTMFKFLTFNFLHYFTFLLNKWFFIFLFFLFLGFLILKKNIRLITLYLWSSFITVILALIFGILLRKFYGILIFGSIIAIGQFSFWLFIFGKMYLNNQKERNYLLLISIIFLFFAILIKFDMTENLYIILISFLVSVIISEIIVILSHYRLLDNSVAKVVNSDKPLIPKE